jgi:hypothetical protein
MHSKGSTEPPWAMNRRHFLRISGVSMAGAALLGVMDSGKALAQTPPNSSLVEEFKEAAMEYEVPVSLLLAMSYVNTRWEMPPPEASAYEPGNPHGRGAYGIMQLVQNDSADTLGEASRLTGIPEEQLKTDRRSNILGGAALLAASQGEKPATLGDYFGAVASNEGSGKSYEAVSGVGSGELYAEHVFETLEQGAQAHTLDGEQVSLWAQSLTAWVTDLLDQVL